MPVEADVYGTIGSLPDKQIGRVLVPVGWDAVEDLLRDAVHVQRFREEECDEEGPFVYVQVQPPRDGVADTHVVGVTPTTASYQLRSYTPTDIDAERAWLNDEVIDLVKQTLDENIAAYRGNGSISDNWDVDPGDYELEPVRSI